LLSVIREILGIDAIADDEELHILEQAKPDIIGFMLIAVDLTSIPRPGVSVQSAPREEH